MQKLFFSIASVVMLIAFGPASAELAGNEIANHYDKTVACHEAKEKATTALERNRQFEVAKVGYSKAGDPDVEARVQTCECEQSSENHFWTCSVDWSLNVRRR